MIRETFINKMMNDIRKWNNEASSIEEKRLVNNISKLVVNEIEPSKIKLGEADEQRV